MEMKVVCFVSENLGVTHDRQNFDPLIGILHVDEELTKRIIIIYSMRIGILEPVAKSGSKGSFRA